MTGEGRKQKGANWFPREKHDRHLRGYLWNYHDRRSAFSRRRRYAICALRSDSPGKSDDRWNVALFSVKGYYRRASEPLVRRVVAQARQRMDPLVNLWARCAARSRRGSPAKAGMDTRNDDGEYWLGKGLATIKKIGSWASWSRGVRSVWRCPGAGRLYPPDEN